MLEVKNLRVQADQQAIVKDVSFRVEEGQWLMIAGPNGAGKSTVINAISQGMPYEGRITYNGVDIAKCKAAERAKMLGVLMQYHYVGYSYTVEEVVRLGRYSYAPKFFSTGRDEDEEKIISAMKMTDILSIKDQSVLTLSGGEMQRTFLAQLLAQEPEILILDEPTNHLDLVYQKQIFELVKKWIDHKGRAVISVVHDLSLAKAYGTHGVLMDKGSLVSFGSIQEVMTKENLEKAYAIDVYQWMNEMLVQWKE